MGFEKKQIIISFHSFHSRVFSSPSFLPLLQGFSGNFPPDGESTLRCRENRESKQADGDGRDFSALSSSPETNLWNTSHGGAGDCGEGLCADGPGAAARSESPLLVDNISGRGSWKIAVDYLSFSRGGAGFSSPSGRCPCSLWGDAAKMLMASSHLRTMKIQRVGLHHLRCLVRFFSRPFFPIWQMCI